MTERVPREHRLAVTRSARCFTLGPAAPNEAWVVLHGYGQLAARFLCGLAPLARPDRLLVAPEGLSRHYLDGGSGRVGASWMTKEDREAEIRDYLAYLEQVRTELAPPVPLTILGFSQGVATAARWAVATVPAPVRLIAWGGLLPEDVPAAALARVRVTCVVGERDEWATPDRVEAQAAQLRPTGVTIDVHRFAGGHEIPSQALALLE